MHAAPTRSQTGLTLLEVLVALVILGLVGTGFLETFAGALRTTVRARDWAQALVYAEQGQEAIKSGAFEAGSDVPLGGGFSRHIALRRWEAGVDRATVTVVLPDGTRFDLDRLVVAQ
jgi:prepilin-type N-terminal cleavage/methylation domain-containing protein